MDAAAALGSTLRYAPCSDPASGAVLWIPHLDSRVLADAAGCARGGAPPALPPNLPADGVARYEAIARALAPPPPPDDLLRDLAAAANVASFLDDRPLLGRILSEIARRFRSAPEAALGGLDGDLLAPLAELLDPPSRAAMAARGGPAAAEAVGRAEAELPAYDRHRIALEGHAVHAVHSGEEDGIVFPCEVGWIAASPSGSHLAAVLACPAAEGGGVRLVAWDARGGAAWSDPTPAVARDGSRVAPAQFAVAVDDGGTLRGAAGGDVFEIDRETGFASVAVQRAPAAGPVPVAVVAATPDLGSVAYAVDRGEGPALEVVVPGADAILPTVDACGRLPLAHASWNRTGEVLLYSRGGEPRRLRMGAAFPADRRYADCEERYGPMEACLRHGDGWVAWSASAAVAVLVGRDGRMRPLLGSVRIDPAGGLPVAWDAEGDAWLEHASGRLLRVRVVGAPGATERASVVEIGRLSGGGCRLDRAVRLGPDRLAGVRGANRLVVRRVRLA